MLIRDGCDLNQSEADIRVSGKFREERAFVSTAAVKCYDNGTSVRTPECRINLVFLRKRNSKRTMEKGFFFHRGTFEL